MIDELRQSGIRPRLRLVQRPRRSGWPFLLYLYLGVMVVGFLVSIWLRAGGL
jgi:hypothetical protein